MNKSDLHSGMGEFHAPGMAPLVCPQPSPHPTGEEREKAKVKQMLQSPNGGKERERAADATLADNAKLQGLG